MALIKVLVATQEHYGTTHESCHKLPYEDVSVDTAKEGMSEGTHQFGKYPACTFDAATVTFLVLLLTIAALDIASRSKAGRTAKRT